MRSIELRIILNFDRDLPDDHRAMVSECFADQSARAVGDHYLLGGPGDAPGETQSAYGWGRARVSSVEVRPA